MKTKNAGEILLHLRRQSGLSVANLAAELGVSPPSIYNWERGGRIDAERLRALCAFYSEVLGAPVRIITSADAFELLGLPEDAAHINAQQFAKGGWMQGPTPGKDSKPSLIAPGEFVMPVKPAKQFAPILEAMRGGASLPDIIRLMREHGGET